MHRPTRRQVLEIAVAAGVAGGTSFAAAPSETATPGGARPDPPTVESFLPRVRELREEFRSRAAAWVRDDRLVRPDGYVYAVDVAQLMACFADAGDRGNYETLRARAVAALVVDDKSDPFTRGFVAWRRKPSEGANAPPDASGTTEALRLARALRLGASAFDAPADRELASMVLRGYARHAAVDHGVWMVRNYFGFATRGFASNSFLVDYDPDFVQQLATESGDAAFADVALKSYALVRAAVTPAGLLYDLVQPELKTMYPLLADKVVTFSPNDIVQLSNAATVALTVTGGAPGVARRVLEFSTTRLRAGAAALRMYHYGRTGEPVNDVRPGINEWSTLVRLASQLKDRAAAGALLNDAVAAWDYYLDHTPAAEADPFVASEALASMSALLAL